MDNSRSSRRVYKFVELLQDTPEVEALGDAYTYLLAQADLIESNGRNMPLNIHIGDTPINSKLIADGIAFGVLYEQSNPSKNNNHSPHIAAPFGFHSVNDIIKTQDNPSISAAMEYLRGNPSTWKNPSISDKLARRTGIAEGRTRALLLSIVFGTYIEAERLRDVELHRSVAEEIYEKYRG